MTRYGCHSYNVGPGPRGASTTICVQDGWNYNGTRRMIAVTKDWLPMKCGHIEQAGLGPDPLCAGCENRSF